MPILAKVKLIMDKEFAGETKAGVEGAPVASASLKLGAVNSQPALSCE